MQGLAQTDPETWLADQWFAQTIHRLVFSGSAGHRILP